MAIAVNSKAAFLSHLTELELFHLKDKFIELGFDTYGNFGFGCADPNNQELMEREIIKPLVGDDRRLVPRVRRLFAQAYAIALADSERFTSKEPEPIVRLHPAEREDRRKTLKARITGFDIAGENDPSVRLIDRCSTILNTGMVKYLPWAKCTTSASELLEEPEDPALRVASDGRLTKAPECDGPDCDTSTDLLVDLALRRRAIAMDIADLSKYEVMAFWHEILKQALLRDPPPGYARVSYAQLLSADKEFFKIIAEKCREGCKRASADQATRFEIAAKEATDNFNIRLLLAPLPRSASGSSSPASSPAIQSSGSDTQLKKLRDTVAGMRGEIMQLKRKSGDSDPNVPGNSSNKRNRRSLNGASSSGGGGNVPPGLRGKRTRTDNREPLCFNYNLPKGCSLAAPGQRCPRGWHLCAEPGCKSTHSLTSHR